MTSRLVPDVAVSNNPNGVLNIGGGTSPIVCTRWCVAQSEHRHRYSPELRTSRKDAWRCFEGRLNCDAGSLMRLDRIWGLSVRQHRRSDFSREFVAVQDAGTPGGQKLKQNWAKYLPSLGELVVIGGSANLLQPMCSANKDALGRTQTAVFQSLRFTKGTAETNAPNPRRNGGTSVG